MRALLSLSVKRAGLGIPNPTQTAQHCNDTSLQCTAPLVESLLEGQQLDVLEYLKENRTQREAARSKRGAVETEVLKELLESSSNTAKRRLSRAQKTGVWLTTIPNRLNGTELSAEEFRDSLRLRYGFQPAALPKRCDGCQQKFSVEHALSCRKGGLILLRHNEVAEEWSRMCSAAHTPSAVSHEPLIPTSEDRMQVGAAAGTTTVPPESRGDIGCRGFWKRGTTAIFDVRVTDTDAPSYRGQDPVKILAKQEDEKKGKYLDRCLASRRQFTPLVFSVDGLQGEECQAATRKLAAALSGKWVRAYSEMCGFVRSRLSFALVRATILCLRGARDKDPTAPAPMFQWDKGAGASLYKGHGIHA